MVQQVEAARSTQVDLDRSIEELQARKDVWARLSVDRKITYLSGMRDRTAAAAGRWVADALAAKGIPPASPLAGEEWMSGPWALLFALNRLILSLEGIARDGVPALRPGAVRARPDGQVVVDVFPNTLYDRLLVSGVTGEVWMEPGVTAENLPRHMAAFYKQSDPAGRVALVLGAGNISSIPPLDVLYKLYAEGQVCLLKLSPVNDYLGASFERVFADLIADGFVRLAYGGADVGSYLCGHRGIETIHMTGSERTHDAIVFGPGEAGAARKRLKEPLLDKPITSELGNVSPTIVLPGPWSAADLRFQAEHIATQKMHNGGFNCIAAQVLVLPEEWDRTPDLLRQVEDTLRETPRRPEYYPGAAQRQQAFVERHPEATLLDSPADGVVPRTLIPDVDPSRQDDICFRDEVFTDVLAATRLPGADAAAFLRRAVAFCNETLRGTLGANIIVHPATAKELGPVLDEAIAALRYGCVGVNAWTGGGFLLAPASWGAYPGHTLQDVGSGIGVVHNTYLFDRPQKSVIRAPFYPFPRGVAHGQLSMLPKPPWFITNTQAHNVGRRLTRFEANPSPLKLPGIFVDALRG